MFQSEFKGWEKTSVPAQGSQAGGSAPSSWECQPFHSIQVFSWWGLSKSGRATCTTQSINSNVNLIQKQPHTHKMLFGQMSGTRLFQSRWHIKLTITVSKRGIILWGQTTRAPLKQSWDWGHFDAPRICICWSKCF